MANALLCLSAFVLLLVGLWPRNPRRWFYRNIYLHTPHWRRVRRRALENAEHTCQAWGCHWRYGSLDVHHLLYRLWQEQPNDLAVLCRTHHLRIHNGFDVPLKGGRKALGR